MKKKSEHHKERRKEHHKEHDGNLYSQPFNKKEIEQLRKMKKEHRG